MAQFPGNAGVATAKETVYSGPPAETVYNGDNAKTRVAVGTVFDPVNHRPKPLNISTARNAVTKKIRYASVRFFVVAAISTAEFFIYRDGQEAMAYGALATAIVFGIIGIFALRLSRGAFLTAMVLYGLESAFLVFAGLSADGGMFLVAQPLIVHGIILYRLYKAYSLLSDLHDLENQ